MIVESAFCQSVTVAAILPLGSGDLGAISPQQTASLSYYLSLPATVTDQTIPGAWDLLNGGYFSGNFSVYVSPTEDVTNLTVIDELNFTTNVDYVCHNHLDCSSCLTDPFLLCGWCEQTQTCHPGQVASGPGENITDCIAWDFVFCQPSSVVNLATQSFIPQRPVTVPQVSIKFNPVSQNFEFNVTVDYVRAGTWVIDFQTFDPTVGLTPPSGSCANRQASLFPSSSCCSASSLWHSAPSAAQKRNSVKAVVPALGTSTYLAYPPAGDYWSIAPIVDSNGNIVPNQVLYSSSLPLSQLIACGAITSSGNQTLFIDGTLYVTLATPIQPGDPNVESYKVAVQSQLVTPFQFTLSSQQQFVAGITVTSGANIQILFLGQTPDGKLDLKIRTQVYAPGEYFGAVDVSINSNFTLQRVYPSLQINSPFCGQGQTPQTSSCTCTLSSPCEQIWEFQSTTSAAKRGTFEGTTEFTWYLYQNYNSIGSTVNSYFNLQVVVADLISQAISIPIQLEIYKGKAAADTQAATTSQFNLGNPIYVYPDLLAVQANQFNVTIDTLMVCYLPNNGTLSLPANSTDFSGQVGCYDPIVPPNALITIVSQGQVNLSYALASQFSAVIYSGGAVQFNSVPLYPQAYHQYFIHAIYNLQFANATAKRSVFLRATTSSSSTTGTGTGFTDFTIVQAAPSSSPLAPGVVAGVVIASALVVIFLVVVIFFSLRMKRKYQQLNGI